MEYIYIYSIYNYIIYYSDLLNIAMYKKYTTRSRCSKLPINKMGKRQEPFLSNGCIFSISKCSHISSPML